MALSPDNGPSDNGVSDDISVLTSLPVVAVEWAQGVGETYRITRYGVRLTYGGGAAGNYDAGSAIRVSVVLTFEEIQKALEATIRERVSEAKARLG